MLDAKIKLCNGLSNGSNIDCEELRTRNQTLSSILTFAAWCEHALVLQLLNRVFKRLQHHWNIFDNKGKVESMLNESLKNRLNLIQHAFNELLTFLYSFNNVGWPVHTPNIWFNKVLNAYWSKCWNRSQSSYGMRDQYSRDWNEHSNSSLSFRDFNGIFKIWCEKCTIVEQ